MARILKLCWAAMGLLLAGIFVAGTASAAEHDEKLAPDISYFVIAIRPANLMLQITEAKLTQDGKIKTLTNRFPPHFYRPNAEGFIVAKAKPGATYVIESASMMAGKSIFGIRFAGGDKLMAFDVPPGKVLYVTDLDAKAGEQPSNSLSTRTFTLSEHYYQDADRARAYITTAHPELLDRFEVGRSRLAEWW